VDVGISNCLDLEEGADEGGWKLARGRSYGHCVKVPLVTGVEGVGGA
jgi:hypothetical protein